MPYLDLTNSQMDEVEAFHPFPWSFVRKAAGEYDVVDSAGEVVARVSNPSLARFVCVSANWIAKERTR